MKHIVRLENWSLCLHWCGFTVVSFCLFVWCFFHFYIFCSNYVPKMTPKTEHPTRSALLRLQTATSVKLQIIVLVLAVSADLKH